jgi:proteasome lid subunit RPN8/RPN11
MMRPPAIAREFLQEISRQAEREYPHECCGMIMGPARDPGALSRLRPCVNVQDKYHALDPVTFPRAARTAYFIDPAELLAIQKENRTKDEEDEEIRVIYHSHIDTGAYFSDEDKAVACQGGSPVYPDVRYLVVSVMGGKAGEVNLFRWDEAKRDFVL